MYGQYLDCIQGGEASYQRQTDVWWYRDTFTEPQDMRFCCIGGGIFIYRIMVSDAWPISNAVGIAPVTGCGTSSSARLYDLHGRQTVNSILSMGLYISDGKKVIVK